MQYHIYALVDPRTSHTRYVGCTRKPSARLSYHRSRSYGRTKAWIQELRGQGYRPVMVVMQVTEDKTQETYWIRHFTALGADLLNTRLVRDPKPYQSKAKWPNGKVWKPSERWELAQKAKATRARKGVDKS